MRFDEGLTLLPKSKGVKRFSLITSKFLAGSAITTSSSSRCYGSFMLFKT